MIMDVYTKWIQGFIGCGCGTIARSLDGFCSRIRLEWLVGLTCTSMRVTILSGGLIPGGLNPKTVEDLAGISIRSSNSTTIWTGNKHNDLASWKKGKFPNIDLYLKELSDIHRFVSEAKVVFPIPTSIWEVGVATGIDQSGNILGNTKLKGPGPNGSMDPLEIDKAFNALGADPSTTTRIFFHDHSEYGSVMTNDDMRAAKALDSVIIARRGDELMMYIPYPGGGQLWAGEMSDYNIK